MGKPNLDSKSRLEAVTSDVKGLRGLMVGVIIVLAIAFGGMLTNYEAQRQASYEDLRDQVLKQNDLIKTLTDQIKNSTITQHQ